MINRCGLMGWLLDLFTFFFKVLSTCFIGIFVCACVFVYFANGLAKVLSIIMAHPSKSFPLVAYIVCSLSFFYYFYLFIFYFSFCSCFPCVNWATLSVCVCKSRQVRTSTYMSKMLRCQGSCWLIEKPRRQMAPNKTATWRKTFCQGRQGIAGLGVAGTMRNHNAKMF